MRNKSPEFIAECARRAAVLEVSAEKPGNVTPTRGFSNMSYQDFIRAADSLKPFVEEAARAGETARIGRLIYDATSGEKNINFGIVIMFMPLAAVGGGSTRRLLSSLTTEDTKWIVKAMQKGKLGGMKLRDLNLARYDIYSKEIFDVIDMEGITPLGLMKMAKSYDRLAREWIMDYPIARAIGRMIKTNKESIITEYLRVLSKYPDTLIARKRGLEMAKKVSEMAGQVLEGIMSIDELDAYLRSDGNALNPGATADLVATGLFIKLMTD